MKTIKQVVKLAATGVLMTAFVVNFNGCSEQSPVASVSDVPVSTLHKKGGRGKDKHNDDELNFPISLSKTYRFNKKENYYRGGDIEFSNDNKSKFQLQDGALTPPPDIDWGKPVTITMEIDYDEASNQLIYTFGPHGCQFEPQAQVKLDYAALGVNVPVLYYIDENGDYIKQTPEYIDVNKKWLKIRVDHFSRYAVAWSN